MEHLDRPKRKGSLPVVLTMEEVRQVLALRSVKELFIWERVDHR